MIAATLAILGALGYAFHGLVTRRAVINATDITSGVLISLPVGLALFAVVIISAGQIDAVTGFSWQSYFWLSATGIVLFVVGRLLYYKCIQLAGANSATIFARVSPLVAVTLGVSILNEQKPI